MKPISIIKLLIRTEDQHWMFGAPCHQVPRVDHNHTQQEGSVDDPALKLPLLPWPCAFSLCPWCTVLEIRSVQIHTVLQIRSVDLETVLVIRSEDREPVSRNAHLFAKKLKNMQWRKEWSTSK